MERSRRAEKLMAALRWAVIAGAVAASWGKLPIWQTAAGVGALAACNVLALWTSADPARYKRLGQRYTQFARALDFAIVALIVAATDGNRSFAYLLYWFPIVATGIAATSAKRLYAVTALCVGANALTTAYAHGEVAFPTLAAALITRTALILVGLAVASFISKTRSREELVAERGSYLSAILKCGTQLTSCASVEDLGAYVLKTLAMEIRAAGAQLLLFDREDGQLHCEASYSPESVSEDESIGDVPVSVYAKWVLGSGRDFVVHIGGKTDEDAAPTPENRSVIATPLLWQASGHEGEPQVLGVLVVWGWPGEDFDDEAADIVRILAAIASAAIVNLRLYTDMQKAFVRTIQSLANSLEARDEYTRGHSERVMQVACLLAKSLGVSNEGMESLRSASLLHDIGKVGVPDAILRKAGKLTMEEWESMRRHPVVSEEICEPLGLGSEVLFLIKHHHERLDGKGYPAGLLAPEQPLLQRILVVADSFDAMRSRRPYRDQMSPEDIRVELHRAAGRTMDPTVLDALIQLMESDQLDAIYQEHDRITSLLARNAPIPEEEAA